VQTLESYFIEVSPGSWRDERELRRLQAKSAAHPRRHVEFMRNLPLTHVEGDYLFVHAGIRPGIRSSGRSATICCGSATSSCIQARITARSSSTPHDLGNAGAAANRIRHRHRCFSQRPLTCVVLDGTSRRFLHT